MTDLNEMWSRLEAHQPFADARGYGDAWAKLCRERTPELVEMAAAAWAAAACAAEAVYAAAADAKLSAEYAEDAIWHIDMAEGK